MEAAVEVIVITPAVICFGSRKPGLRQGTLEIGCLSSRLGCAFRPSPLPTAMVSAPLFLLPEPLFSPARKGPHGAHAAGSWSRRSRLLTRWERQQAAPLLSAGSRSGA